MLPHPLPCPCAVQDCGETEPLERANALNTTLSGEDGERNVHCGPGTIVRARLKPSAVLGLKKSRFDHLRTADTD